MFKYSNKFDVELVGFDAHINRFILSCYLPKVRYVGNVLRYDNLSLSFIDDGNNFVLNNFLDRLTPDKNKQIPFNVKIQYVDSGSPPSVTSEILFELCVIEDVTFGDRLDKRSSLNIDYCSLNVSLSFMAMRVIK